MIRSEPGWGHETHSFQDLQPRTMLPVIYGDRRARRKRVAFVGPSCASLAVSTGPLIADTALSGHDVICFAPELKDAAAADALTRLRAEIRPIPSFRQGFSPIADQRSLLRLINIFRQMQPDIVAGYSPKGAALAGLAARITRVPHIVAMIGELGRGFEETSDRMTPVKRRLQTTLLRLAFKLSHTAIVFNHESHKLLQHHQILDDRIRQFPTNGTGVDLDQFPPAPLPPLDRGVMFLYAGPLDRRFGIAEFCKAARQLRAKPGHYKCLVAGPEVDGPHGFPISVLKRFRDVVQYLGPKADPRPYMARTHVFVLPAKGDAVPQALIEAVAMGRPVITSTSRGCRVAVNEGANGMIVPPGDANALAGAMARLLQRPDLIPSMSRASRQLAESQFDSRRINALLRNAFDL